MSIHTGFMFSMFAISCISLTFYIISASTNNWITAKATYFDLGSSETINYGLFSGTIIRQVLASKFKYGLTVVCDFSEGVCLYSCQDDADNRKLELSHILNGEELDPCSSSGRSATNFSVSNPSSKSFGKECIPAAYWLCTLLFLMIATGFTATSAVFALINLMYRPVEPIFNVFGLYIWNIIAAVSSVLTLALWAALFLQYLVNNVAISDTLNAEVTFISKNNASLGSSYYIAIIGLFFNLINIGCLVLRYYLIKRNAGPSTITIDNNDTPLQFY